ncbi:MAG TPA: site-2 protease family protein, partial [Candidatus Paceibacterota bacterium]|nr:site-2 protease family protein [Candidatus Paceibacterota bacterium]
MTIILFIIVLALLILTHELGHFLTAKWGGIRVDEFGLGLPPRV